MLFRYRVCAVFTMIWLCFSDASAGRSKNPSRSLRLREEAQKQKNEQEWLFAKLVTTLTQVGQRRLLTESEKRCLVSAQKFLAEPQKVLPAKREIQLLALSAQKILGRLDK